MALYKKRVPLPKKNHMGKVIEVKRYAVILEKILDDHYPSSQDLLEHIEEEFKESKASEIGCSMRTLRRDLKFLRQEMKIPIKYSRHYQGYHVPEDDTILSIDNFKRLMQSIELYDALDIATGIDNIVFLEKRYYKVTDYIPTLIKAIKDLNWVCFQYQKFGESQPTERKIYPYALKECRARWYLLGVERNQKNLKAFGLDRISNIKILPAKFKKNPEINIKKKYKDLFGIVDKEELPVENITISFNYRDGQYVKSLPIHHSQDTKEENPDKDEIIFTLRLKITEDLVLELLSRGKSLKVIEPQHLVEKICDIYRQGLERYKC